MELDAGKIEKELKRIGIKQAELARKMHISRALLSYRLKSKNISHAKGFAKALGFSGKDLIKE